MTLRTAILVRPLTWTYLTRPSYSLGRNFVNASVVSYMWLSASKTGKSTTVLGMTEASVTSQDQIFNIDVNIMAEGLSGRHLDPDPTHNVGRGPTDEHLVAPRVDLPARRPAVVRRNLRGDLGEPGRHLLPVALARVPIGERTVVELELDPGRRTRLQVDAGEGLQFFRRPRQSRCLRPHVALHHLGSGALADVAHLDRHRDAATRGERAIRQPWLAQLEGGVPEAVPERIGRRGGSGFEGPVAHEERLA